MGLLNRKPGGLTENPRLLNRKPRGLTENPCLLNRSPLGLTANPCLLNRGFADAYTAALQQIKRVNTLITPMAVCWFSYVDGTLKSITWTYPCLSQTGVSPTYTFQGIISHTHEHRAVIAAAKAAESHKRGCLLAEDDALPDSERR